MRYLNLIDVWLAGIGIRYLILFMKLVIAYQDLSALQQRNNVVSSTPHRGICFRSTRSKSLDASVLVSVCQCLSR